jgi:vitamin B12 transporter
MKCFALMLLLSSMSLLAQKPILQDTGSMAVITTAQYPDDAYTRLYTSFSNDIIGTLESNPNTQIQSNSPGGLVTALSNGMGARHFAIIWDDVNIQSPINGTFDLNLIPAFLFTESLLISQTINPSYGNASMAGGIFLKKDDIDHISINHLVSNTENHTFAIRAKEEIGKLNFELGHQRNNYNHKYAFLKGSEKRVQQDAQYNSSDWIADVNVDLHPNWQATIKTWIQDVRRDLSPSKTALYNGEYQEDQNQRYSLNLLGTLGSSLVKFKYAHFNEQLNFFSNVVDSRANNRVHNYLTSIQNIPILRLNFGVQIRKDAVDTNFGIVEERHNVGLNASKQYQVWNNISAQFQVRKDWVDKKSMPLTYRIGFDYQAKNALSFHIDLSKNYNLPTFNDLYWPFGGNELLLNEESYQYNISAFYSFKQANSKQGVKVGLQYQDVENWILWRPENGIWTPNNQKEVQHIGLSLEYAIKRYLSNVLSLGIDYSGSISSTIIVDSGTPSTNKGNQLIFIPQQKHTLQVSVEQDVSSFEIHNNWVGKRYTTTDNLNSLPAYYITDITYKTQFSSSPSIYAWITIHNLFNHNYEVIPFFPTPLRHLSFGIQYNFI